MKNLSGLPYTSWRLVKKLRPTDTQERLDALVARLDAAAARQAQMLARLDRLLGKRERRP